MSQETTRSSTQGFNPANAGLKPVVTIFEQYGAGADDIGRAVAEAIGHPYHAQAISSEAIEGDGADADADLENRAVLAEVYLAMGGAYGGHGGRDVLSTQRDKHDLIADNNNEVRRFAEDGGVIVGRNAALILANRPHTVHVLLTGERHDRITRGARHDGIDETRAQKRQQQEDKVRVDMSRALYGWDPLQADRYDLVINTSRIPEQSAIAAIIDTVRATSAQS